MKKESILWRKRIAALLAVSMLVGDIGSGVVVANATTKSTVQDKEKSVEIPKKYISLNETEQEVFEEDINSKASVETVEKKIPILRPSDGKEESVEEEAVDNDGSQSQETILPKQISIVKGLEEYDSFLPKINAGTEVTPDKPEIIPTGTLIEIPTKVPTATGMPTPMVTDIPMEIPTATPQITVPVDKPMASITAVPTATGMPIPMVTDIPMKIPTATPQITVPVDKPMASITAVPVVTGMLTPMVTMGESRVTPTPTLTAIPIPTRMPTPTVEPIAIPTVTPVPTISHPELNVGEVISVNGEEEIYDWRYKYYTVTPEVSGYYSLVKEEFTSGMVEISVEDMNGYNLWYSSDTTVEYKNNHICYMEAGVTYTWKIGYYFYDTSGSFSAKFMMCDELQREEDKFTGIVREIAGFNYSNENVGILKIDLNSSKGYTYYMMLNGTVIKLVKDEPSYVFLSDIGEKECSIWKNSQDEDEVEISFELTEENVIPKTGGIINVKTTSYKQDNSSAREEMLVSFVPENSGYYTFHNQLKSEVNCSSSIYEESVNDNGSVLDWKASTYGTPGSNIVELEAGKKYYYYIVKYFYGEENNLLGEIPVCIKPVDEQKISVGTETKTNADIAAMCSFTGKKCTFYEVTIATEAGNDFQVILPENVNSLGNQWSFDVKDSTTFKIYTGIEGEYSLKFLKKDNFDVPATVSVKVTEYEVSEMEEDNIVTNETQLSERDSFIRKFVATEDGKYNFWAINYSGDSKRLMVFTKNVMGYMDCIGEQWCSADADVQVYVTAGTEYYVEIIDDSIDGQGIVAENYLLGIEKAVEDTLVIEDENTEAQSQLGLYKSANITLQIPKTGFYDITVTGEAGSYKLEYDGPSYVLYSGIGKEFYFAEAGEYSLKLFREIKRESKRDQVTISVEETGSVTELLEYTDEAKNKVELNLEESSDFKWVQFTPEETASYLLTCKNNMNLQLYTKEEESEYLSSISIDYRSTYNRYMCYYADVLLEAGKTYYVKVSTWDNGAQANIRLLKNSQIEVETSVEASVETQYGTVVQYQVPENGIYQISVTGTKQVYNIYGAVDNLKCKNGATQTIYLSKGLKEILIVPQGKAEDGKKYKKEQITVKLDPIPTEDIAKEINMNETNCWVKYEPEETDTYYIGTSETASNLSVTAYLQGADGNLWDMCTLDEEYGDNYNVAGSFEMEKGYTYYFKVTSYNVPNSFVMYVTKDTIMEETVSHKLSCDFSKHARVDLQGITGGFYQVTVNGEGQEYGLSLGTSKNYPYYRTVTNGESNLLYVDEETAEENTLYLQLSKAGIPSQEKVDISIEKVEQQEEALQLNQKMKKESTAVVDFYSFTPEKDGYYSMKLEGIDTVEYIEYGSFNEWYNGKTLKAGQKYTLLVRNSEGNSYSITPVKTHDMVVYDQKEYQAFIASGGTITLRDTSDITEEMWEELYQWNVNRYTYVDANKILITSVKDFKNKSDIWFLGNTWIGNEVYEPVENYVEVDKQLKETGSIWTHHLKGYVYQNLCDENGNIILPDDEVINEYIAWANYTPEFVPVHKIQIQGINVLKTGETSKLTALLDTGCDYPPTDNTVTWSSSDSSIISVDNQGNIKANKQGTAVITCTANDKNQKSATMSITVSEGAVYASKVIITGAKDVTVGDTIQLKATLDTNGKGKPSRDGVIWSSNNTKVATVDQNGKVTGISKGTAVITATSQDGKAKADYTITVKEIEAKKVTLNETKITMKKGTTYTWLEASVSPKNTTDQSLKWSSSNTKVATVIGNGKIKAKGIGKATITVTTSNGKKDTVKVTVTKNDIKVKKIELSNKETLYVGGTISLSPEFTPLNATNKKVKWSSSNEQVATVSKSGVVTAKKEGKATITVTTLDGSKKKAKCVVTVKKLPQVKGVKLSSTKKGTVKLTWKDVKDADGYNIYMSTSKKGEYKKIGTVKAGKTEFTKNKLSSGKKYYFKVVGYQTNKGKQNQGKESAMKDIKVK